MAYESDRKILSSLLFQLIPDHKEKELNEIIAQAKILAKTSDNEIPGQNISEVTKELAWIFRGCCLDENTIDQAIIDARKSKKDYLYALGRHTYP